MYQKITCFFRNRLILNETFFSVVINGKSLFMKDMKKLKVDESNRDKKRARTITKYIEKEKWKKLRKYLEDENIDPGFKFFESFTDFPPFLVTIKLESIL
jgi:hypothetical protein